MTLYPKPGDFGLSRIEGSLGFWIMLGQAIAGDASRYTHAFVVLDNGTVVEAQPGGARIVPLEHYIGRACFSNIPLTDKQRDDIVAAGRALVGTPYSFLDYVAIGLTRLGLPSKRVRQYVQSRNHMICSQLVDEAYRRAGVTLFTDNRLPQDVTPGSLANLLIERDWIA